MAVFETCVGERMLPTERLRDVHCSDSRKRPTGCISSKLKRVTHCQPSIPDFVILNIPDFVINNCASSVRTDRAPSETAESAEGE